jgi:hypothetical protein
MAPDKTENKPLIGQATEKQIADWKAQYKQGIYKIEADGHVAYFQNPTRDHVHCALACQAAKNPLASTEELAKLTLIGGSEVFLNEDDFSLGINGAMDVKMNGKRAALENL